MQRFSIAILQTTFPLLRAVGVGMALVVWTPDVQSKTFGEADLEFFEKRIRPVLVSACFDCHSHRAEKLKGGLFLDTRAGVLKGGDSGAAAIPSEPDASRMVEAIEYDNVDLQMPPKSKLTEDQIADLKIWISKGLPWPAEAAPTEAPEVEAFDLAARRASHWAWQPVEAVIPPNVKRVGWARNPVDAFILHRLEERGLAPAPETSRRNQLRRLSFGLTGLPPSPERIASFQQSTHRQAYDQVVDELLSSPRFGERWGRHWLDLVRYAETLGHEFDYAIPNAWRYRDYLIRAFNQGVSYDQFVLEHVAGDLVPTPRTWQETGINESVTGTGFYWLGQQVHSPVDIEMNQLDVIDNQIDVLSKTFLGMTFSCARCHDHKFDAISTKDFYSFFSVLSSSRYHEAAIDAPAVWDRSMAELRESKGRVGAVAVEEWKKGAEVLAAMMSVAMELNRAGENEILAEEQVAIDAPDRVFEDFESEAFTEWEGDISVFEVSGAIHDQPAPKRQGERLLVSRGGSKESSDGARGTLLSPTFRIERNYIHFLLAGGGDRRRTVVRLLIDGDPVRIATGRRDKALRPMRMDVREFRGQSARIEIRDLVAEPWGFVALDHIVFSQREHVFGKENRLLPSLESIGLLASQRGLDPVTLRRWVKVMDEAGEEEAAHPLRFLNAIREEKGRPHPVSRLAESSEEVTVIADVAAGSFSDWFFDGPALEDAEVSPGELILNGNGVAVETEASIHSARFSRRFQGSLRSPTFEIKDRYLHVLAAGESSRINVVIDNFNLIRSPIYGGLKKRLDHGEKRWVVFDLDMWIGHECYLELKDTSPGDLAGGGRYTEEGWFAVTQVIRSSRSRLSIPFQASRASATIAESRGGLTPDTLLAGQQHTLDLLDRWSKDVEPNQGEPSTVGDSMTRQELGWLAWLAERRLLESGKRDNDLDRARHDYAGRASRVKSPTLVPSMTEGSGVDHAVFVRGNPRVRGAVAARGGLEALPSPAEKSPAGSRRWDLAKEIVDPANPLTARVYVNRVWHHLFGRGIVPTTDNFGVLGQVPSHPELLDWLAHWFVTEGQWSTKRLIRLLVTSATYRMASQADASYDAQDPTNALFHKMPVKRLEGEAIRDAILQVSGEIDLVQFGPSVPVHLTPFMTGRGRPGRAGPLDGNLRRSIYQEVRRNFLSPMMLAFDAPIPHTTFGKRSVSNVPAQALILMNDPFVIDQSERWARRLVRQSGETESSEQVRQIYLSALGREPTREEARHALDFLEGQIRLYGSESEARQRAWADLCHVVLNVKEFIFLE